MGKESFNINKDMTFNSIIVFFEILQLVYQMLNEDSNLFMDEIRAKAWAEKNGYKIVKDEKVENANE